MAERVVQSYAPYPAAAGPEPSARAEPAAVAESEAQGESHPLGAARAQIHENYILAQSRDGLVIVDRSSSARRPAFFMAATAARA